MNKPLQTSSRLGVVDALRGFALLAIVLLHNLEHYNIYFIPNSQPEWLQIIEQGSVGYTVFLILPGKLMPLSHCYSDSVFTFNITMQKKGE